MSFLLRLHPKGYPEQCKINNWLWLLQNALNLPKTPPLRLTDAHNPSANPQPANEVDSFSVTKGRPAPRARRPLHTCAGLTSAELPFLDPKPQAWTESHTLFPPTAFYPPPLSAVTGGPLQSAPAARPPGPCRMATIRPTSPPPTVLFPSSSSSPQEIPSELHWGREERPNPGPRQTLSSGRAPRASARGGHRPRGPQARPARRLTSSSLSLRKHRHAARFL